MSEQWRPIKEASREPGKFIRVMHKGRIRTVGWGKTSHMPWVGWCLADQGAENFDLICPQPTEFLPMPAPKRGRSPMEAEEGWVGEVAPDESEP